MAPTPTVEQTRKHSLPYILDDSLEALREVLPFKEEQESEIQGPSAVFDFPTQFLSMSEYGKSQSTHKNNSTSIHAMEDPLYLAYAQTSAHQGSTQHHLAPYTRGDQMTYGAGSIFPRQSMNNISYTSSHPRNRQIPEISDWMPQEGPPDTELVIELVSPYELEASWNFAAVFGDQETVCDIIALGRENSYYKYQLSTYSPRTIESAWAGSKVQLSLKARDVSGHIIAHAPFGEYTYTDQLSPDSSRKRKASAEAAVGTAGSKKMATQLIGPDENGAYTATTCAPAFGQQSAYLPAPSFVGRESSSRDLVHYHEQASESHEGSPIHTPTHIGAENGMHTLQLRGPSPSIPWNLPPPLSRSPNMSVTSDRIIKQERGSPSMDTPHLMRTSTLHGSPSPSSTPNGAHTSMNPYAMYPGSMHKVTLKLQGDLEDMTKHWTASENEVQRRLVQFYRRQDGGEVHVNFEQIAPEERQPQHVCVSCIWWEAKGECYVTSVDTIALLEYLVGGKFGVMERNRIRRNLEGLKPTTVSKGKADSEDFFKLIMGFPSPKPRNIEKDVKVFPWKSLNLGLKKILDKYSASYASMETINPTTGLPPLHRRGYQQELTRAQIEYNGSEPGYSASNGQFVQLPGSHYHHPSPASSSTMALSYSSDSPNLQSAHTPEYPLYQYPGSHIGQNTGLLSIVPGSHHGPHHSQQPRHTWEFGAYLDHQGSNLGDSALYALPAGQQSGKYSIAYTSSGN